MDHVSHPLFDTHLELVTYLPDIHTAPVFIEILVGLHSIIVRRHVHTYGTTQNLKALFGYELAG
jgi:hypothetical protein